MDPSRQQPRLPAAAAAVLETADLEIVVPGAGVEVHSTDERDWARLHHRIVGKVANDLLLSDVTEYIRVRAVCKPWRSATADPSHPLRPRFFPRNWAMDPNGFEDGEDHRFVNALTGDALRVRLPTPYEFSHHGATEGLLVLLHTLTDTVCFLNPLTLAFTELPFFSSLPGDTRFDRHDITAAGIIVDEAGGVSSSRRPRPSQTTVVAVLCVTMGRVSGVFCARLGGLLPRWEAVDAGCVEAEAAAGGENEEPAFKGGLAVRGRFYIPTRAGNVLAVQLRPRPRLAYVARQDTSHRSCINRCFRVFAMPGSKSYLAPSIADDDDGMLLVLTTAGGEGEATFGVFNVNLTRRRVRCALANIGDRAVFLPCTTLRASAFPFLLVGVYAEGKLAHWFETHH